MKTYDFQGYNYPTHKSGVQTNDPRAYAEKLCEKWGIDVVYYETNNPEIAQGFVSI